MKLNKIAASFVLIASMAMVSCSEGQYWDGVSATSEVYGFAKPSETVTIPSTAEFPTSYTITVRRAKAGPALTIPVTNKADNDLMTGPAELTFADGSTEATYEISIAPGGEAGVYYKDVITLQAPKDAPIKEDENSLTFTLSLYHELNWVNAGTVKMTATGAFETGEGEVLDVQVQVATNWPKTREKMCRLVSPFYALDPEGTEYGHDIWFILDNYNEPYRMYDTYQYTGYMQDDLGFFFFTTSGGSFRSKGDVFTMSGSLLASTTESVDGIDASQAWKQTLKFTWTEYDWKLDQYGK